MVISRVWRDFFCSSCSENFDLRDLREERSFTWRERKLFSVQVVGWRWGRDSFGAWVKFVFILRVLVVLAVFTVWIDYGGGIFFRLMRGLIYGDVYNLKWSFRLGRDLTRFRIFSLHRFLSVSNASASNFDYESNSLALFFKYCLLLISNVCSLFRAVINLRSSYFIFNLSCCFNSVLKSCIRSDFSSYKYSSWSSSFIEGSLDSNNFGDERYWNELYGCLLFFF